MKKTLLIAILFAIAMPAMACTTSEHMVSSSVKQPDGTYVRVDKCVKNPAKFNFVRGGIAWSRYSEFWGSIETLSAQFGYHGVEICGDGCTTFKNNMRATYARIPVKLLPGEYTATPFVEYSEGNIVYGGSYSFTK
jgi:hypothetical protein